MAAPAQLQFVSSLFTSKIFWAQVVTLVAMIASACGIHLLDAPGAQEQLIGVLDAIATVLLRLFFPSGPVSLGGPLTAPDPLPIPAGTSVVSVTAPPTGVAPIAVVQPLSENIHTVDATTEIPTVKNPR